MQISKRFLNELQARIPVSTVVGRRVRLKKRGREYIGLCPFHDDKNPSLTVNDQKHFYHCFSCGAHGDVVSFVRKTENSGFLEAVKSLAAEVGMEVREETAAERRQVAQRQSLLQLVEKACAWFADNLGRTQGEAVRDYLAKRRVSEETQKRFRLGYAPPNQREFLGLFAEVPNEDLVKAGLVKLGDDGKPFAYFRNRLIFPIFAADKAIAFGGRALDDNPAKYLNSPLSEVFNKSASLYAEPGRRLAAPLFVVEGYMDVLTAAAAGVNAVAPLGTAMGVEQLYQVWRYDPLPTVCFDGDAAGASAAFRLAERALPHIQPERSLGFIALPEGSDPDSYILANGAAAFKRLRKAALPMDEFIFATLEKNAPKPSATPERRTALRSECHRLAALVGNQLLAKEYRRAFDDKFFKNSRFAAAKRGEGGGAHKLPWLSKETAWRQTLALSLLNHPTLIEALAENIITKLDGDGFESELLHGICDSPLPSRKSPKELRRHLVSRGFDIAKLEKSHISTHAPYDFSADAESGRVKAGIKNLLRALEVKAVVDEAENMAPAERRFSSIKQAAEELAKINDEFDDDDGE